ASPEAASSVLFHNEATAPPLTFMQPLSHCSFQDTTPFVRAPVADQLLRQTPSAAVSVQPHGAWHLAASSEPETVTAACVAALRLERHRPDSLLLSLPTGQLAGSDRARFALPQGGQGECTLVTVAPMVNLLDWGLETTTTPICAYDKVACAEATARGPGFWNAQAEFEFTPTQSAGMSAPPITPAIGDKHGLQAAIAASYGATAAPARRSASWPEARSIVVARPAEMASSRSSAILPTATTSMTSANDVGKPVTSSSTCSGGCTLSASTLRSSLPPVRVTAASVLTGEVVAPRRLDGSGAGVPRRVLLRKTELCSAWLETGTCEFGAECDFAHSTAELRPVTRHPSWRTKPCNKFWTQGSCPYGNRCAFIHSLEPGHLDATTVTTLVTLATTATSTTVPAPPTTRPRPIALRAAAAAAMLPTRPWTAPPCCEAVPCGGSCSNCAGATPPVPAKTAPTASASAATAVFAKRAARARAPAAAVSRAALQRHASLDGLRVSAAAAAAATAAAAAASSWQSAPGSRRDSTWSLASPPPSASPSLSPLSPPPLSSSSSLSSMPQSLPTGASAAVAAEELGMLLLMQTRGASASRQDWGASLAQQRRGFPPTCF
ncbi:hypothetical protein HK405_011137, partial [Cladochytrium tenue]